MIKEMLLTGLEPKLEVPVKSQTECLVMGVKSKIYQPLLKRNTCCNYKYFSVHNCVNH